MRLISGVGLIACAVSIGQPAAPSFEVATIHPASADALDREIQQGRLRIGVSINQSRADIAFLTLADLIPLAYGVKPNQVDGPDWMKNDHWDILAKLPEGASQDQVPEMIRALLAERFMLQAHEEIREQNVYVLSVAKDGIKLKPAAGDASELAFPPGKAEQIVAAQQGNLERRGDGKVMTFTGGPAGVVRVTLPVREEDLSGDDLETVKIEMRVSMATFAADEAHAGEDPQRQPHQVVHHEGISVASSQGQQEIHLEHRDTSG